MENTSHIDYLERRLQEFPKSPLAVKLAEYYLESGCNLAKAIFHCKSTIIQFPDYLTAYLVLTKCFLTANQFDNAYYTLQKANHLFPEQSSINLLFKTINHIQPSGNEKIFHENNNVLIPQENDQLEKNINSFNSIIEKHKLSLLSDVQSSNNLEEAFLKNQKSSEDIIGLLDFSSDFITIDDFEIRNAPHLENLSITKNAEIINELILDTDYKPANNITAEFETVELTSKITSDIFRNEIEKETIINELSDELSTQDLNSKKQIVPKNKFDLIHEINILHNSKENNNPENSDAKISEDIDERETTIERVKALPQNIVSKTLANIFESQEKYIEAIEVYKQLFNIKAIKADEYERKVIELQFKLHQN